MSDPLRASEADGLPRWVDLSEQGLHSLRRALLSLRLADEDGPVDREFLRDCVQGAMEHVVEARRLEADPVAALRAAVRVIDEANGVLALLSATDAAGADLGPALSEARRVVAEAAEAALPLRWSSPAEQELMASREEPRLHGRFHPALAALTESSASAEPAEPNDVERAGRLTEAERSFVCGQAREVFDDLTMLCTQRTPQLGESWQSVEVLEGRMLACLDALVALGRDAVSSLQVEVVAAPALDPARILAFTWLCSCIEGRDAFLLAERVLDRVVHAYPEAEAELLVAFGEGLVLGAQVEVGALCSGWLRSPEAPRRGMALDVLVRRGLASERQLRESLEDEACVAAVALPRLALLAPHDLRDRIDDALGRQEPALERAAWLAMLWARDPRLNPLLTERLRTSEVAATLLGVNAERVDAQRLLEEVATDPTPALVQGLGFSGLVAAVPLLTGLLETEDFELRLAAANALRCLTGVELWEEILLSPERLLDGPAPASPPSLGGETSDDRDDAPEGSPDRIELPTMRGEPWRDWWRESAGMFDPSLRYRRGQPHEVRGLVRDLLEVRASRAERAVLSLELTSRWCGGERLDVADWVSGQRRVLAEMAAVCPRSSAAGSWTSAGRR